jgi:riboflavin synthase
VFTGLVQALGRVAAIRPAAAGNAAGATRIEIDAGSWPHRPDLGASISVNGCCLTVVGVAGAVFHFDVIPQTLAVTGLGRLRVGDGVNLEHAATPTTFLGGHVVLGHVDGLAEVVELRTSGEWRVRLRLPGDLGVHAVDKGSITLDGVSLTIARVEDTPSGAIIDVCLIPETLARTNLAERKVGDKLQVEVDYIAKLVARQLEFMKSRA